MDDVGAGGGDIEAAGGRGAGDATQQAALNVVELYGMAFGIADGDDALAGSNARHLTGSNATDAYMLDGEVQHIGAVATVGIDKGGGVGAVGIVGLTVPLDRCFGMERGVMRGGEE